MARMSVKAGDEYLKKLALLSTDSQRVAERAVYKAAGIVADQIRKNLTDNLKSDRSAAKRDGAGKKKEGQKSSGDLLGSLGIAPIQLDKDGFIGTKIGFDGYDRRGVPNPLKARVMESGSSKIAPRPFVRPAVKATKKAAEEAMGRVIDEEIEKLMKG